MTFMASHRKIVVFFLSCCLLTSCFCSKPARSRRQKRGIAKMMMHIMWDPVRLIRYWYAYDVTKEIAKSWRKIIPTILLLPITQHMPHSHGLAKYVHPTVGIRDHNKSKIKLKYPSIPVPAYAGSAGNLKPVIIAPSHLHHAKHSKDAYVPAQNEQLYQISSKETDYAAHYGQHKNSPQIIVGHVPYEDDKDGNHPFSVAHYFVADETSREEVDTSDKIMFVPGQKSSNSVHMDSSSSSSQNVPVSDYKKRHPNFPSISHSKKSFHHIANSRPKGPIIRDENGHDASPVLHPGQEFHIVLHPIPIDDFSPDTLKPPSDGKPIQFVPVHLQSNDSEVKQLGPSPILFKAIALSSAESDDSHEEHSMEGSHNVNFPLNSSESAVEEQKTNASTDASKSRVTWVPHKNTNSSKRTDKKDKDLHSDGTVKRIISVHSNFPQKHTSNKVTTRRFAPKRHNINMDRLKEDLKHGTPVLIPFNKKEDYSSEELLDLNHKNQVIFPDSVGENSNNHPEEESKVVEIPVVSDSSVMNTSGENSGERNTTQKLILFLKRKKEP